MAKNKKLPKARFGNQAQFDDLARDERNARDGAGNREQIYTPIRDYASGGEAYHDYIPNEGDTLYDLEQARGGTETSGLWGSSDAADRIERLIGKKNAILSNVTPANMQDGGALSDRVPMGGITSAFRGDWKTFNSKKCCK